MFSKKGMLLLFVKFHIDQCTPLQNAVCTFNWIQYVNFWLEYSMYFSSKLHTDPLAGPQRALSLTLSAKKTLLPFYSCKLYRHSIDIQFIRTGQIKWAWTINCSINRKANKSFVLFRDTLEQKLSYSCLQG